MVPIKVKTIHEEHPDLMRKELDRVTRAAHREMGNRWARRLLPEHFAPGARGVFGYAPRTRRWLAKKRALVRMGKADPAAATTDLVFTGRLRDALLRTAPNLVTATPRRTTIRLIGPEYFTLRPRGRRTAQLARDVLAMSARHERLVGDAAESGFNAELSRIRRSRRLRKETTTT